MESAMESAMELATTPETDRSAAAMELVTTPETDRSAAALKALSKFKFVYPTDGNDPLDTGHKRQCTSRICCGQHGHHILELGLPASLASADNAVVADCGTFIAFVAHVLFREGSHRPVTPSAPVEYPEFRSSDASRVAYLRIHDEFAFANARVVSSSPGHWVMEIESGKWLGMTRAGTPTVAPLDQWTLILTREILADAEGLEDIGGAAVNSDLIDGLYDQWDLVERVVGGSLIIKRVYLNFCLPDRPRSAKNEGLSPSFRAPSWSVGGVNAPVRPGCDELALIFVPQTPGLALTLIAAIVRPLTAPTLRYWTLHQTVVAERV